VFNTCTKYELSIFNHSNDTEGVPKLQNGSRDPSDAALGINRQVNL